MWGLSYDSLNVIAELVDALRTYIWAFTGTQVPPTKNVLLKSPTGTRVIFNVDEGDVNVINIDRQNFDTYALGNEEVTVLVAQEFHLDFVEEVEETVHDPIEITMDKITKKNLEKSLNGLCGSDDEEYWMRCEAEHQRGVTDIYLHTSSGNLEAPDKMPQLLATSELNDRCRQVTLMDSISRWMERGKQLVQCRVGDCQAAFYEVGPGQRHLRWTATTNEDGWKWG